MQFGGIISKEAFKNLKNFRADDSKYETELETLLCALMTKDAERREKLV